MKRAWFLVALPLALGLLLALWFTFVPGLNPVLFVRANIATWAVLIGLLGSALLAVLLLQRARLQRRERQSVRILQAQAADERRRFLQRLDHEFKNPLTAMRAGLANLAAAPFDDAQRESLLSMEAQTVRLSTLTSDLRKLADLEIRPIDRAPIDLEALLRDAAALAQEQPEAHERRLSLILPQAPWPLPAISGDRDLLFLAVLNLLNNALKFTRAGDTVELRAFEDGASVNIEVADTGPGIPASEVPHVWEELYRGKGARGLPGSGLGLPLVRAIAERHGGQVTLRSRTGQGTVFTLRLPVG